jgi:hypothetical protein
LFRRFYFGNNRGCETKFFKLSFSPFFVAVVYVLRIYFGIMDSQPTPQSILQDIAQIQQLERGTVSIIRQGPQGPYHNHQCYEKGRNVSRYVPLEQVADLKAAIDGYHQVQEMMAQYVQLMVDKTRAEREAGAKKKFPRGKSSSRRIGKSKG